MKHDAHLHTLTGAYALDALTGEEQHAFTAHLRRCEACLGEVGEFEATAARLAAAVSLPAPAPMRQAVLTHIDTVRQASPRTRPAAPARLTSALTRRAGAFVIAASIAAAAAFGGVAAWQHRQSEQARTQAQHSARQAQDLAVVLAAPDARTVHGRTTGGATTTVVTSALRDRAAFVSSGLPTPPAGRTYQLWFDDHGTMRPAGLVSRDGATLMEGGPGNARAVGLTLEPAGGSPRPTTTPLLLLPLTV
ncbi:anti-sigma factor [Streptomyces avidinii]|uniref:anti-sigma factor n=1 Tax=Streptomyces avidinii TaxID=1895 RepID=UPI00386E26A3|nr:anti-sigma factor [Streptomyces avidinii]WTB02193.1 anti-sigma factor [Streptomyces avidinii]